MLIEKLLIANRGEIAVRIIRSARKLGIRTVAVYASNEENAFHVRMADEAYGLGEGELTDTYLNISRIVHIARSAQCNAIHPGYGFLSENAVFADACQKAGLIFVGPSPDAILRMGNKVLSRELAVKAGLPVTRGVTGDPAAILEKARDLPFPVLVKAASGGGGKGMRIVEEPSQLAEALESTAREARTYFGDGTVYLEQYILEPRHIEIQVLGDHHGNLIHLFERECSIQRRYQKIVEESPSATLTPEVRQRMGEAAVDIAKTIGYSSAGTVEFLVDRNLNFYFLEMNTRIQVEHPVTEMVTGVDLVLEQLHIASGTPLRISQETLTQQGHAIECRIYAEDPANNFMPSPGDITLYREPAGKDIRLDSSIDGAASILSQYDPMISKLIVWGENRDLAILQMLRALDQYVIHGIHTNIPYLKGILREEDFRKNQISTAFCATHTDLILAKMEADKGHVQPEIPLLASLLFAMDPLRKGSGGSTWERTGFWRMISDLVIRLDQQDFTVEILRNYGRHFHFLVRDVEYETSLLQSASGRLEFTANGKHHVADVSMQRNGLYQVSILGLSFRCERLGVLSSEDVYIPHTTGLANQVVSPMPGKVVKVNVTEGQAVTAGEVLLVVEAMKMENNILAPRDGVIGPLNLKPGDLIDAQKELIQILDLPTS
ncbi:MAG TPA: acetyl-CoA carboxylase biotin carboxylase subunit [Bacteroidales bacterium]|nr:acetyl-CoA carboxylase biotin carboxylase subunit [Bacteroidales bacterium]HSA44030.1 acetyl-CoA carboxylase biotin carboxylase subunit [Bacteroidales bacterium]